MTADGDSVVWAGWPQAPAPLAAIRRAHPAPVVDDAGREVPFGPLRFAFELVRSAYLRVLDALLAGVAATLSPRRTPPTPTGPREHHHVVLVLPVLPDLSHTFVYREVLAIRQQRPDWRIIVLDRNARAPVHAEAAALLPDATFVPRDGITRRAARVLGWLLRRRGRELFGLYRSQPGGSVRDLLGKNPLRDARHPGNAFALADLLRRAPLDHVHVYSSTYAANVAMGAAHLLGVPFSISSYVDFEFPYAHKMLAEKVARARFFRVVSQFDRQVLRAQPELPSLEDTRVPVVDFGLDVTQWTETRAPTGRGVLVSAARLVEKKGFHLVPSVLAALRARGLACRWRLLGEGPDRARIEREIAAHDVGDLVDLLGACDNASVRRELLAADLALLPCVTTSDGERDGIPIFLVEAMALCVPVVTTPVAGIPEIVRDDDTGFLAPSGDAAALVERVATALADADRAAAIGRRGREAVLHKFDVRTTAAELVQCIEA
ncbi:MAG: glycosyltransferase [Planctomycetes bacterium]|nr:glycosyltransferase [Planctomycetota bacterium]